MSIQHKGTKSKKVKGQLRDRQNIQYTFTVFGRCQFEGKFYPNTCVSTEKTLEGCLPSILRDGGSN